MARFRHVLAAVGGHDADHDARLVSLAASVTEDGGEVTLLGAAPVVPPPTVDVTGLEYASTAIGEQAVADDLARERLAVAARQVPTRLRHQEVLSWGPTAAAVLEELAGGPYDAVVVGHEPRGELSILAHGGSVAHRLLHHSPVPVLVIPWSAPPVTGGGIAAAAGAGHG